MKSWNQGMTGLRWLPVMLVLAVLYTQSALVIHASSHEFHKHDASCAVYQHADHQQGGWLPASPALLFSESLAIQEPAPIRSADGLRVVAPYQQRAPPVLNWIV
jgi:hypothetical protein